jgi:SAM-dependent methyltransferase
MSARQQARERLASTSSVRAVPLSNWVQQPRSATLHGMVESVPSADDAVGHEPLDLARHRDLWAIVNERFTDADADHRWAEDGIRWGLFRRPESELGLLGDVCGLDLVELGCGTAFLSASLARAGARPVAVDLSRAQLATARRCQRQHGVFFPLVEADCGRVPLRSGSFDLVVSEYGAAPWCDPTVWLAEAARLLRSAGRLVFMTHSVTVALCVPEQGGVAGDRLLRGQRDVRRVAWPGGGIEHHPAHGEWIRLLQSNGFELDALHEIFPPADAATSDFYEIVTGEWATKWPAEDAWVAHRGSPPRDGT